MLKLSRPTILKAAGAALLVAALVATPALTQQRTGGAGGQAGGPPPSSVFVEPIREQTFSSRVEAIGTLEPNERADLTLTATDRVTAIFFEDGDRVKKGKTLLSLAQREQVALVESAEADLAQANIDLTRIQPLAEQGAVSASELDVARRNVNTAAAQLRAVQSRQNDRVLIAPFDGVLGFRRVSVGSLVRPGDVVATLIDDSVMRLEFAVPSTYLRVLRPGLEIQASTSDLPGQTFTGTVDSIDNAIDPVTRSVRVRAKVPNPAGILTSGMYMSVNLMAEPRRALAIPEVALQPRGPETFVWVADTSGAAPVARRVKIEPGLRHEGRVEVVSGLEPGQLIISEGTMRLREGAVVKIEDKAILQPGSTKASSSAAGGPVVNGR
ncbi:efflux RND transporter periplasmic adaptor subunit [Hyphomonas sp. WL0036]|uniref:efflux RND transporter periplasmic adaptor subunit n=1 Tax=Hyphomonas sediminis TaxID=2866160 RepID=UPI001C7E870C|nr:efflux RND transporter periplasmic adaptor subunit [Hyphomonas sediminis]MBY9065799.1 efflux RND transporter periplasmic adaptor subunit [Hyphomonas sediminis]